jgi:hypothetical protein
MVTFLGSDLVALGHDYSRLTITLSYLGSKYRRKASSVVLMALVMRLHRTFTSSREKYTPPQLWAAVLQPHWGKINPAARTTATNSKHRDSCQTITSQAVQYCSTITTVILDFWIYTAGREVR